MRPLISALTLIAPLLFAAACSTNPATGEQSFTAFMSETDELRVGAEEHPKILKEMGIVILISLEVVMRSVLHKP